MGRGNGIRKLILLGLDNHADKHGRGTYPSTRTIADYAECDVRTMQRHVGWLIANGNLHEGDQRMVDHLDPRYRPIVYDVAMTTEHINQWAADAADPAATGLGQRKRVAAAAGHRPSSSGVTICHPCPRTNHRGRPHCPGWTHWQHITHPRRQSGALAGVNSAINAPACGKISFAITGPTAVPSAIRKPPRERPDTLGLVARPLDTSDER